MTEKKLIRVIDTHIQNMGTNRVYHPNRLKPKWNSLKSNDVRLELFIDYVSRIKPSVGLIKLVEYNLCEKTLEAVYIDNFGLHPILSSSDILENCKTKFYKFKNGRRYINAMKSKVPKLNHLANRNIPLIKTNVFNSSMANV